MQSFNKWGCLTVQFDYKQKVHENKDTSCPDTALTFIQRMTGGHSVIVRPWMGQQQERKFGCGGVNVVVDEDADTINIACQGC